MRRASVVSCALAAVLALGACGEGDPTTPIRTIEPQRTASSASPNPEKLFKNTGGCDLLTPAERRSIAGVSIDTVAPGPVIPGALLCRWVRTLKTPRTISIGVISQPRKVWIRQLPMVIDNLTTSGRADSKYTKRLQSIKRTAISEPESISAGEACDIFSFFVEVAEGKKGRKEGFLFQGTQYGDFKVTWQRCSQGVHTELVYEEPGLQVSIALAQSVVRLGKAAHRRALKELA